MATFGQAVGVKTFESGDPMRPSSIRLVSPAMASVQKDIDGSVKTWTLNGKVYEPERIWHLPLFPRSGEIIGLSPISEHARVLGLAFYATKFLADFYSDGAHPSAILSSDASSLTPEDARTVKERFMASIRGREPLVTGSNWKYTPMQISPVDADLLTSMRWSAAETARIWGPGVAETLGYDSGDSKTYANIVDRRRDLLTFTIDPYLIALEQALTMLTPGGVAGRRAVFDRTQLLRMDQNVRYQSYQSALASGWLTVDEVRASEGYGPLPAVTDVLGGGTPA